MMLAGDRQERLGQLSELVDGYNDSTTSRPASRR